MLIAIAAINEGFDATHIPSYGPESRGGTSYADVHVAAEEVLSPAAPKPDILIAFNAPSLAKFGPDRPAGRDDHLRQLGRGRGRRRSTRACSVLGVPFTEIAVGLGKAVVKNIVALGALQAATNLFPKETFLTAVRRGAEGQGQADPAERGGVRRPA